MSTGLAMAAIAASVTFAVVGTALVVSPLRRLGPRVRPYTTAARVELGLRPDISRRRGPPPGSDGAWYSLLLRSISRGLDRLASTIVFIDEESLALRLRQSGLYPGLGEDQRPQAYRIGALGRMVLFASGLIALGLFTNGSTIRVLAFGAVGALLGGFLARSRLTGAVRRRRESIRAELYTIDQLVAMYTRVGGGALEAIRYVVERARGVAVDEMAEVIHLHERGWSLREALERAERLTPEPEAGRTYRLMATSQEQGSDLAQALLDLSKDLRSERRDDLRRQAARRRILMVIPVVVILAPVTLLFMAAPIPSIVFGG